MMKRFTKVDKLLSLWIWFKKNIQILVACFLLFSDSILSFRLSLVPFSMFSWIRTNSLLSFSLSLSLLFYTNFRFDGSATVHSRNKKRRIEQIKSERKRKKIYESQWLSASGSNRIESNNRINLIQYDRGFNSIRKFVITTSVPILFEPIIDVIHILLWTPTNRNDTVECTGLVSMFVPCWWNRKRMNNGGMREREKKKDETSLVIVSHC